jgi:hypothetical protein
VNDKILANCTNFTLDVTEYPSSLLFKANAYLYSKVVSEKFGHIFVLSEEI